MPAQKQVLPKVIWEESVATLTAENAFAWIVNTRLEVAHPSVECTKYWAFEMQPLGSATFKILVLLEFGRAKKLERTR